MASYDISVRGAGIFGLSIAWACAVRGARVEVVDPNGLGAGASGGIVGALAPHVPENWNPKKQFQFESLLFAETFWSEVAEVSGLPPGYVRAGRLQPLADEAAIRLAEARRESAKSLWHGRAVWEVTEGQTGWALPSPTGLYIHDTLSAHMHPRQACAALAAALARRGVLIHAVPDASGAEQVIWATGAQGLEDLSQSVGATVGQGIKGQAALFALDRAGLPQLFVDTLHIIPHLDGTVAVGSTTERDFTSPTQTDAQLEAIIAAARSAVPDLADAPVIARWAGLRPRARSRAPMIGPWPGRPGHFIANGGFKIGFGMAPKLATLVADMVHGVQVEIPEGFGVAASIPASARGASDLKPG